ncbi:Intradiol ring-cleavage dioxygenase [Podospora aff. communis PSN243]|uniref:Intradiol ring-cleavage dioxygenase n=1 Tax=Podospora aff. communis PSN243 TaxID=3040156 RepID=A0AAV9GJB0_9PEZI|nr:Intradiol ring-cleavage dioxygenase [Podospora aff. communis PSN243]
MYSSLLAVGALAATLFPTALAHPGERIDVAEASLDARVKHAFADLDYSELSQCGNNVDSRLRAEQASKRRMETFLRLRQERGISSNHPYVHRRNNADFAKWAATSHDKTGALKYTTDTPNAEIFRANSTCVLTPDNIIGPYFVHGEQIRSNIVEGHRGVPLHLEMSFVNTQNCKATPNLLIDIWQCNATGVYSGVSAAGQAGLKTTFLRGVQQTSTDGVVEFDTIFPGHYQGRATHIHVSVHSGATVLPNNTYTGGTIHHISQLFFDQALINKIAQTAPYNTNRAPRTSNAADMYTGYSATSAYDPFPEYVLLDANDITKGIFMWIEISFNQRVDYSAYKTIAAYLGKDGGTDNRAFDMRKGITPPPTHG